MCVSVGRDGAYFLAAGVMAAEEMAAEAMAAEAAAAMAAAVAAAMAEAAAEACPLLRDRWWTVQAVDSMGWWSFALGGRYWDTFVGFGRNHCFSPIMGTSHGLNNEHTT